MGRSAPSNKKRVSRAIAATVVMAAAVAPAALAATCASVSYQQLLVEGAVAGPGLPFMALYSSDGKAILNADKSIATSNFPDAITLHAVAGTSKIAMVSHTEFPQPGGLWVSTVERSPATGALTATRTSRLGLAAVNGVGAMCAGSSFGKVHLGGEEYPPDCRGAGAAASAETARFYGYYSGDAKSLPNPPNKGDYSLAANAAAVAKLFSCYNMGAVVEVEPFKSSSTGQLDGRVTKLRTMGRFSHETAVVAPDRRTVMSTADDRHGVFSMFVADKAGDLRSGTLYAARFTNQQGPTDPATGLGASWDVEWVKLGKGKQASLNTMASSVATKFSSILEAVEPNAETLECPEGYSHANTFGYKKTSTVDPNLQRHVECLKVMPGKETAAAFLETQRYASMMGATTEFEKLEGVDYSKELKKWFIAISSVDRAMLDGATNGYLHDNPNNDGIRLPKNKCGLIIELTDFPTSGKGAWQPTRARVILAGTTATGTDENNSCDVNGISSPDNVFVVPGTSTLMIAEDTDWHANNVLWSADVADTSSPPQLTRILSASRGAEITGLSAATFGAHAYIPMAFQHPDVGGGSVGYLGPFPRKAFTPLSNGKARAISFDGIDVQTGGADENAVVSTGRVCY